MKERKAVIALAGEGEDEEFAGFCYIESWGNKEYVANSGLIVVEKFRHHHLATRIKQTGLYAVASALAARETVRTDQPKRSDENQYGLRICAGYVCRTDR